MVIFCGEEDRDRARRWSCEGHDRVLLDRAGLVALLNGEFEDAVDLLAMGGLLFLLRNAVGLGKDVVVVTDGLAGRWVRLRNCARNLGVEVVELDDDRSGKTAPHSDRTENS